MGSLKSKIIKGALWNTVTQFGAQGLTFVVVLILARLLDKEDFGLLGMATVITGFASYFSEFGLTASLVKKKEIAAIDCYTTFWATLIFAIVLFSILFVLAPVISQFYDRPELTDITRTVSLVFPITAFSLVPITLEIKRLRYDRIALVQLVALFVSGVVTISLAFQGFGIWALVFQLLVSKICESVGILLVTKWYPRFQFSWESFKELIGFGTHITMLNLIKYFSENVDYLLIGKMLGASSLGIYTIAFKISKYPVEKFYQISSSILFPAFSSIQHDPEKIKNIFSLVTLAGAIFTVPLLAVIYFSTHDFVYLAVGPKWIEAVSLIKILIIYLVVMSLSMSDEALLTLMNIKMLSSIKLITSGTFVCVGYFMIHEYGMRGGAFTYAVLFSVYWILIKITVLKELNIHLLDFVYEIRNVFFYILMVLVAAWASSELLQTPSALINLLGVALTVACVATAMLYWFGVMSFKSPFVYMDRMVAPPKKNGSSD